MKTAALELATLVKTQILAKGGTYVAVMTLSDIADTPFGNSPEVAPARSVLTALSETFNLWLREGLTGQPVQIIDTCALYKDALHQSRPTYGIVNNTGPACDLAKIQAVTGGAGERRLVAVLQCHAGRALQHPHHRRRRQHLAVRRQRPSDDRRPQDHRAMRSRPQLHAFGWI